MTHAPSISHPKTQAANPRAQPHPIPQNPLPGITGSEVLVEDIPISKSTPHHYHQAKLGISPKAHLAAIQGQGVAADPRRTIHPIDISCLFMMGGIIWRYGMYMLRKVPCLIYDILPEPSRIRLGFCCQHSLPYGLSDKVENDTTFKQEWFPIFSSRLVFIVHVFLTFLYISIYSSIRKKVTALSPSEDFFLCFSIFLFFSFVFYKKRANDNHNE